MISILIITMDKTGEELLKNAQLITNEKPKVETLSIDKQANKLQIENTISKILQRNSTNDGLIVLTDILATNYSNFLIESSKNLQIPFEIIYGINLPMCIAAFKMLLKGETNLEHTVREIKEHAIRGIITLKEINT